MTSGRSPRVPLGSRRRPAHRRPAHRRRLRPHRPRHLRQLTLLVAQKDRTVSTAGISTRARGSWVPCNRQVARPRQERSSISGSSVESTSQGRTAPAEQPGVVCHGRWRQPLSFPTPLPRWAALAVLEHPERRRRGAAPFERGLASHVPTVGSAHRRCPQTPAPGSGQRRSVMPTRFPSGSRNLAIRRSRISGIETGSSTTEPPSACTCSQVASRSST